MSTARLLPSPQRVCAHAASFRGLGEYQRTVTGSDCLRTAITPWSPLPALLPTESVKLHLLGGGAAERQYMDAQRSGAGLELGAPSEDGGYTVVAPLPGSPVSSTTDFCPHLYKG